MKHINKYKIFESIKDIEDEVKECFLPVIDIIHDDLEIQMRSTMQKQKYVAVYIRFPKTKDIIEELINEIVDSAYHCRGYNFNISGINIKYKPKILNADWKHTGLIRETNPNIEDDFAELSHSLLKKNHIHFVYIYLDKWRKK